MSYFMKALGEYYKLPEFFILCPALLRIKKPHNTGINDKTEYFVLLTLFYDTSPCNQIGSYSVLYENAGGMNGRKFVMT